MFMAEQLRSETKGRVEWGLDGGAEGLEEVTFKDWTVAIVLLVADIAEMEVQLKRAGEVFCVGELNTNHFQTETEGPLGAGLERQVGGLGADRHGRGGDVEQHEAYGTKLVFLE